MAKPKPLVESSESPELRSALGEARAALGSEDAIERLRAKLGELPATEAPAQAVAPETASAALKVVLGTVVTLLLIGGAFMLLHRASPAPAAPDSRALAPQPIVVPQAVSPAPAPAPELAPAPLDLQETPQPKLATPKRKPAAKLQPPAPAQPAAPKELELLTQAQDAIDTAPQRALGLLDEHARIYPSGNFALERESLAIDALRKLGRTTLARERARRFIARFPNASNAKHLQRWLDESATTDHNGDALPLPKP